MEVRLTTKGQELAAMLVEQTEHPREVRQLVQPHGQFEVTREPGKWTLANDVLVLLGGYWSEHALEADTLGCSEVARAVSNHLETARVVAEEILMVLGDEGLVELTSVDPAQELRWLQQVSGVFGNDSRTRIILALRDGPLSTPQIREAVGPIHVMTARYHLQTLRDLELVEVERENRTNHYALAPLVICTYIRRLQKLLLASPWDAEQKRMLTN